MYSDYSDGIYFVEGAPAGSRRIAPISTKIDGMFSNAQLKSLDDIKAAMASEARRKGGNAIIDFKYGQKQRSFWGSLFSLDDVRWEASGAVATINPATLNG